MTEPLNEWRRVATKPMNCDWCDEDIEPGETFYRLRMSEEQEKDYHVACYLVADFDDDGLVAHVRGTKTKVSLERKS